MSTSVVGRNTFTIVLPISVAKEYGLDSSRVVVELTSEGILIKKPVI